METHKISMILLIRANHANAFELQNYAPIAKKLDIHVITSHRSLTPVPLPTIAFWSPTDLPNFPYKRQLLNRILGGEQWLLGLEKYIDECYHVLRRALGVKHSNTKGKLIIHSAETYTPYTHQAVQLRKAGKIDKLICTCWETIPHNNEKFFRLRKWKEEAYQYVDIFHTPTQRAKKALVTEGVNPSKITVIPYGVDLTRFQPIKRPKNIRPLILTVARLESEKGMKDIQVVAHDLPQYDFLVVGQGSRPPLGKNITVKSISYPDIHQVYQSADLFLLPSRTTSTWEEQYGMALVEAMACGLPIITTHSGAIPEVVRSAGITLPISAVDKMVITIRQILTHPDKRKTLSQHSFARAKHYFDATKVATQLATLYN